MRPSRRQFLQAFGTAPVAFALPRSASAFDYPSRPVRIIVGYAAGGGSDILARLTSQWLSERLGQSFIVENRPGAATNVATEAVTNAAPDGCTLLMFSTSVSINASLYDHLNFNFIRDIAPVASIARSALVMLVHPSFQARTVPGFVAYTRANPGKVIMASAGTGGATHVAGKLFEEMAGLDMVHVPYRGDAPALADLLGGQVHIYFGTLMAAVEYVRTERLRALAVTTSARVEALPEVPTIGEYVRGYEVSIWNGLGAPQSTPAKIIEKLNTAINAALAQPFVEARLAALGMSPYQSSPTEFGTLIAQETDKWARIIKLAGIRAE
jgi:tripartite-type tricarboxylate transporter receptor subunit TctC